MSNAGPVAAAQIRFVGSLKGRFLLPDRRLPGQSRQAVACRMQSISIAELAVESDIRATPGEHFESVFEELGPLRGKVLRPVKSGFVVALAIEPSEQESLSRTIEWLKKRHTRQATNKRASPRFDARGEPCVIYAGDLEIECKLADVSADGAMLVTTAAAILDLDANVVVGRVPARVVRRQPDRIGVEFAAQQSLKTLLVDLKATRDPAAGASERQFFRPSEPA